MSRLVLALVLLCSGWAMAHEPMEPSAPTLSGAQHDRTAVAEDWRLARQLALRLIADPSTTALLSADMYDAIDFGDAAVVAAQHAETADAIEAAVYSGWSAVAHVVNAALPKLDGAA